MTHQPRGRHPHRSWHIHAADLTRHDSDVHNHGPAAPPSTPSSPTWSERVQSYHEGHPHRGRSLTPPSPQNQAFGSVPVYDDAALIGYSSAQPPGERSRSPSSFPFPQENLARSPPLSELFRAIGVFRQSDRRYMGVTNIRTFGTMTRSRAAQIVAAADAPEWTFALHPQYDWDGELVAFDTGRMPVRARERGAEGGGDAEPFGSARSEGEGGSVAGSSGPEGEDSWPWRRSPSPRAEMLLLRARVRRLERDVREMRDAVAERLRVRSGRVAVARPAVAGGVYMPSTPILASLSADFGVEEDSRSGSLVSWGEQWRPGLRGGVDSDSDDVPYEDEHESGDEDVFLSPSAFTSPTHTSPYYELAPPPDFRSPSPQGHRPGTLDPVVTNPVVTQLQRDEAAEIWLAKGVCAGHDEKNLLPMMQEYLSGEKDHKIPSILARAADEKMRRAQEDEDLAVAVALAESEKERDGQEDREFRDDVHRLQVEARKKGKKARQELAELAASMGLRLMEDGPVMRGGEEREYGGPPSSPAGLCSKPRAAKRRSDPEWQCGSDSVAAESGRSAGEQVDVSDVQTSRSALGAKTADSGEGVPQNFEYDHEDPRFQFAKAPKRHRKRRDADADLDAVLEQQAAQINELQSELDQVKKEIAQLQACKTLRMTTRLAWLFSQTYCSPVENRRQDRVREPLKLKRQGNKRLLQKLADKLVLKIAVKLIWKQRRILSSKG
ncbi:hypothetical protein LTR08_006141 [Meristemomyces frigidus]|nr:hypothetical protein LTR08_006141 [Meristemomyces frigidus]